MSTITSASSSTRLTSFTTTLAKNANASKTLLKDFGLKRFVTPSSNLKLSREAFKVNAEMDPPNQRKFTGFVEKDTAGQTNIYAVEPDLYVSKSAISTNSQGISDEGGAGTLIISGFLAVAAISGAAAVLSTLNNSQTPSVSSETYSGPPLDYYVQKFQANAVDEALFEASISAPTVEASVSVPIVEEPVSTPIVETSVYATESIFPTGSEETPVTENGEVPIILESASELTLSPVTLESTSAEKSTSVFSGNQESATVTSELSEENSIPVTESIPAVGLSSEIAAEMSL